MKKLALTVTVTALAVVGLAAAPELKRVPKKDTRGMTEAEKEEYYRQRREYKHQLTGGFVENYAVMKGEVVFLNAQKRVAAEPLEKRIGTMAEYFRCKFLLKGWEKPITLANAAETLKACGANAAVFVVDDPTMPVTILSAPETNWIFLNVAGLAADKPDATKLLDRTRRELWRAAGFLLGNGSVADVCVMKSVGSLKELDELGAEAPSSGPLIVMSRRLKQIGVEPYQRSSYSRALREGWAPMPTNEIQKAVYERYQEMKKNGTLPPVGARTNGFLKK